MNKWLQPAGVTLGIIIAASMLFANQIGLDNNQVWGAKRYVIFFMGIMLLSLSLLYRENNLIGRAIHTADGRFYSTLVVINAAIFLIYLWFASGGMWIKLPNETNYFDLQANAFIKGQLHLDVEPDPALLALEDRSLYVPENREGIPVLWDATLYQGKYYLYWGPAPALLLALIKPFHPADIGDKALTLLFISGALFFLNLIILDLWRGYFSRIPRWAVLTAIAFAGLVNPMPYIMVEGRIYEASIIAAQFFLIGGFYFLLLSYSQPTILRLFMTGFFFAFAVGSRTTLVPAVGFTSVIVLIWAIQEHRSRAVSLLLSFALPLLIGAAGYIWYNHARFDSITEFGYRYQLTSYNLYERIGETFAIEYLPPNLYKSLLNPLERREAFPYIFPTRWMGPDWLEDYQPRFYLTYAENITGILISSPFVLLAFLTGFKSQQRLKWLLLSLIAAFISTFVTLQAFFFVAMRYMLDAIPTLAILSIIGFWHGFDLFPRHKTYSVFASLLLVYTLAASLLISFSGNLELFKIHNPDLVKQMTWTFNAIFK